MRMILQRVLEAKVSVRGQIAGQIGSGLLAYVSVGSDDTEKDVDYIADKLLNLRIFSDEQDKMNLCVKDVNGAILLISNFTLHGDCRKGRRPALYQAAEPQKSQDIYEQLIKKISSSDVTIQTGMFGEQMDVSSINDGPINFLVDSSRLF